MTFFQRWLHFDVAVFSLSALFSAVFLIREIMGETSAFFQLAGLALIGCLLYLGGILYASRTGDKRVFRIVFAVWFAFYLYLLVRFTLFDESFGRNTYRLGKNARRIYLDRFVNFTPLKTIRAYLLGCKNGSVRLQDCLLNLVGNLIAFMPMAFFLPYFFKRLKKTIASVGVLFATVLAVEGLQFLFMVGSCDVDDLILNTLGAAACCIGMKIPPIRRILGDFSVGFLK